jgi:hypothetical protein
MPYTMADFRRDYVKEHLKDLTPEVRLEGLSPEQRLVGLTAAELEALRNRLETDEPPRKAECLLPDHRSSRSLRRQVSEWKRRSRKPPHAGSATTSAVPPQ